MRQRGDQGGEVDIIANAADLGVAHAEVATTAPPQAWAVGSIGVRPVSGVGVAARSTAPRRLRHGERDAATFLRPQLRRRRCSTSWSCAANCRRR
jgi:hypothetical protein